LSVGIFPVLINSDIEMDEKDTDGLNPITPRKRILFAIMAY
jgi:hypothetical protein